MTIEMYIMIAVWLMIYLVCRFMLRKNLYIRYMKEENGKTQWAVIKKWEAKYYTRPTLYEIMIEYAVNGEIKRKTLKTSSSFLKKYKNEKYIQIVTIPGTDFVVLQEEKWIVQNLELRIAIFILTIGTVLMLLIGFLDMWSVGKLHRIIFSLFFITFLYLCYQSRPQTYYEHKTRMKYNTNLSYKDAIKKFGQEADKDFQFEKEKEDIKDEMYILSINNRAPLYRGCLREKARYRVLVTTAQQGCSIWFYLLECSDNYALDQFAEKLRNFMEEKMDAFRDE
ncbi:MAG: hypothetical protein K2M91_05375 [Lachnospiraceae bacterium]|nr:hypothetical protein [Lachnospiraceae bacterium]